MKLKKVLLTSLSFVLVAAIAIGGTIAYLTSTDSDINVMTMGEVSIEQHEYERVVDENGAWVKSEYTGYGYTADELQKFTQAKPAYPAVYQDGDVKWDDRNGNQNSSGEGSHQQPWSQVGAPGSNQLFDDSVKNVIDKFVFVENTGKTEAYYRTVIAVESPEANTTPIHLNENTNSRFTWDNEGKPIGYINLEGSRYALYVVTYNEILKPGEVSRPSLLQLFLDPSATNEDCAAFGATWDVLVISQAVQASGFDSADEALDKAFYDVTTEQHPWVDGVDIPVVVATADELIEALESGKDVVLNSNVKIDPANMSNAYGKTGINVKNGQSIDGNGYTLDIKGAGGTWDSGINTTGGVIKNITITGSFRGVFVNHNSTYSEPVVLENVIIDGTTYTISCDQGMKQNLIANDSTFNGWTSFAATLGEATFTNCSFGEGNGYAFCRPYAPTTFVGCDFEAGYEMDPRAAVTFEDCTIGGVALTSANLSTLVTSNIANAAVK